MDTKFSLKFVGLHSGTFSVSDPTAAVCRNEPSLNGMNLAEQERVTVNVGSIKWRLMLDQSCAE